MDWEWNLKIAGGYHGNQCNRGWCENRRRKGNDTKRGHWFLHERNWFWKIIAGSTVGIFRGRTAGYYQWDKGRAKASGRSKGEY